MNAISKAIKELGLQRVRIDAALRVLHSVDAGKVRGTSAGTRNISPEGRARIVAGQKKRWAKVRTAKEFAVRNKAPRKKKTASAGDAATADE